MSRFFVTCQTETNTSNVVVICRFILVDIHQVQPPNVLVHLVFLVFIIQRNGPTYIQDFKDLLTH